MSACLAKEGLNMNLNQSITEVETKMVAFIACAGSAAGVQRFSGCASCRDAVESGFLRGECKSGCVGVGDCTKVCTKGALAKVNGKITVDREKCDGCGDCAKEGICPQQLIRMIPADATNFIPCSSAEEDDEVVRATCGFGCIACGECERACPDGAVHIMNNHAVIDYEKCVGCAACTVKCKKKIIVDTLHDISILKSSVAFVRCSGDGRISEKLKSAGIQTCKDAAKLDMKQMQLCTTGCLGLGECAAVCRYDAIHVENDVARVDPDKCVGCRDCTYACPRKLITIVPYKGMKLIPCSSTDDYADKAAVCSSGCIGCGDCKTNCPNGAVYSEDRHCAIDPEKCEDCKICQYVCQRNVIRGQEVPEYIFLQREALLGKEAD